MSSGEGCEGVGTVMRDVSIVWERGWWRGAEMDTFIRRRSGSPGIVVHGDQVVSENLTRSAHKMSRLGHLCFDRK